MNIPLHPLAFASFSQKEIQMEPLALPPKEAFAAIGVGVTKGYELIASGDLQTFKVGRATRVTTESIRAYVARQIELCSKAA
ncbi:helix-turn-helix domain-containing protein [Aurantiacibacter zhengii]|nr:helix-turn-helix domain-containing protein [Aurantiacibacter zhengii]